MDMWNAQDHYDAHADSHRDRREALRARARGPSAPLKRYHNAVKRQLINTFASGANTLLDLACGRGGDIAKWTGAGVRHVTGVDISPGEIDEARARAAGAHAPYEFFVSSALDWEDDRTYDVVTCMFAIHYFFESEETADAFFNVVSSRLKPGGYFIGAYPDGDSVLWGLSVGNRAGSLQLLFQGSPQPFGSPYRCTIADTVVDTDGSVEYLVFRDVLVSLAAKHGLTPVLDYDLGGMIDPVTQRFRPILGVS